MRTWGLDVVAAASTAADVGVGFGDVGEGDVDEDFGRREFGGVDVGDGLGEVVFLGDGEGDCVEDFVEGHCGWLGGFFLRWGFGFVVCFVVCL